ncbi:MAG: methyltransferase domain-containing protein, partial [Planctomycetota bacterium]
MPRDPAAIAADFDELARLAAAPDAGGRNPAWVARLVPAAATRVLDVGCGAGGLARALARPGRTITGLDLAPEMIRLARRLTAGLPGLDFHVADFMTWS